MASYTKSEAREWARENLRGVSNSINPCFTADLKKLNEAGIRHDIRKDIEYGFSGALLVSEFAISLDEYRQFFEWANDESKGRIQLIFHATFNTLEENIEACKIAEANGAELVLLSYPANFYPESAEDIYAYTKAFADATNLAILLFQVPLWGFNRIHPSDIDAKLVRRMIDTIPNVAAIKAEGGLPSIMGIVESIRLFSDDIVVSHPLEQDVIPLAQLAPIQYTGPSNTEYYGPMIPKIFQMVQDGKYDEATELYWKLHPARTAYNSVETYLPATLSLHRALWKFKGWLTGFNGGPLRQPVMRLNDQIMNRLRQGLIDSDLPVTEDHNREYYIGRNPA